MTTRSKYQKLQGKFVWMFAAIALLNFAVSALNFAGIWPWFGFFNLAVGIWCAWEAYDSYRKSGRSKRISTHNARLIRRAFSDANNAFILTLYGNRELARKFMGADIPLRDAELYHRAWLHRMNRIPV